MTTNDKIEALECFIGCARDAYADDYYRAVAPVESACIPAEIQRAEREIDALEAELDNV